MKVLVHARIASCFLFLFLTFAVGWVSAQNHSLSGKITDGQSRQPLAFVNVVVNGGLIGVISDIDGKYEIATNEPITKVLFSSVGYEAKEIVVQPNQKKCDVALTPKTFELKEVTVEAGENPAHRIIDSLFAHRKANNPNSLDAYRYKIYDQMVFTVDSTELGNALSVSNEGGLQRFDSILKKSDLMVMETASEVIFKSPDRKLQNVLGTKVAGMKEPTFIYLVNSMQSVSFYDETVNITGTDYVNPISRDSKSHYFFTLETVNPIGQGDSLYVISFHPMRGSTFNGLRGTLTVNSDGWALQSVKASPNEPNALFVATIQQLYQKVENQWFPQQLNTILKFSGIVLGVDDATLSMVAVGKSYLTDIEINPDLGKVRFSEIEINVDPAAAFRDDSFWNDRRIDSLTERIRATYNLVDSITEGNDIFDRVLGVTNKLVGQSALPLGPIDLNIGSLLNISRYRGIYLGLGATTNDRLSRWFSLNGFFGYWTGLKRMDYGGGINFKLNRQRQMEFGLRYTQKMEAIGDFGGFQESYALLSESDYKYTFYENIHACRARFDVNFSTRMLRHFKVYVNLSSSHKFYNAQFFYSHVDSLTEGRFTNAEVKVRFAYNEKFLSTPQGLQSLGTAAPIVWFSYMHSFPHLLGGQFEYDRFKFEVSKNFYTPYMGVAKVVLQAGYASATCPVMETFDILGTYDRFGLYSPGSFSTMRLDEFFCDRFAALYMSHNFSGMLWKTNSQWFKPELTLVTNIGWGDMKRAENHLNKNFKTMEKGYFESGFVVKGLLNLPLMKVGLGAFYRYGPYSFPTVWENFAWKWSAVFSF